MQDVFMEQLIKWQNTPSDRLKKAGLILAVLAIFFLTMAIIPAFGVIVTMLAGFGAYVLMGRLNKEFEYSFTNGELDIDVIYNKSSRKRIFNGYVRDFEIMAHVNDPDHKNSIASANEHHDYSSGITSDRSYVFLTNYKSKRVSIIMEPNDEMLAAMAKALTRRKFHPKK